MLNVYPITYLTHYLKHPDNSLSLLPSVDCTKYLWNQTARLFSQYLAICSNEYLPNSAKVGNFSQY